MNIYVGNLPFSTTAADLETLFGEYGAVDKAAIINDRETGRSRGSGSWRWRTTPAPGQSEELDGADCNGRNLKVNEARPARSAARVGDRRRSTPSVTDAHPLNLKRSLTRTDRSR